MRAAARTQRPQDQQAVHAAVRLLHAGEHSENWSTGRSNTARRSRFEFIAGCLSLGQQSAGWLGRCNLSLSLQCSSAWGALSAAMILSSALTAFHCQQLRQGRLQRCIRCAAGAKSEDYRCEALVASHSQRPES